MKPLFPDHRKYAYVLILTLSLSSLFFAVKPTGMVTSVSTTKLAEIALSSETVREFMGDNRDFKIIMEELTHEKLALLQQEHSQLYSNLPDTPLYQMIIDGNDKALLILLNNETIFKIWETNLGFK